MLTQGKFLISYQIFDNIQVNNIGQTHVREILKDTQAFTINYRTEQIRDYLKYPGEELIRMDLTKGADDQYYDYSPSQVEAILFGIPQLTPEHQDIIVINLKKHLKSFIQDKDQAEEMITQYTCYYNAIKRWESNHKETEILYQLEISNLLEQLKNN